MQPRIVGAFLGVSFGKQLRASLRPLAVTAVLLGAALWAAPRIDAASWLSLIASAAALAFGLALFVGLGAAQRGPLLARYARLLSRGSDSS